MYYLPLEHIAIIIDGRALFKGKGFKMTKKVLVPIADGTEEIEAVCIIDVLRRAGADLMVASVGSGAQICASRGVKITADCMILQCIDKDYDLVVLPGGMPGAERLRDCQELAVILKKQYDRGAFYAAICASPVVVLAHHGLIGKRLAVCYPSFASKLANVGNENVVVDGPCITSRGPATAIEFALKLVEVLFGKDKRDEVAKALLF